MRGKKGEGRIEREREREREREGERERERVRGIRKKQRGVSTWSTLMTLSFPSLPT